MFVVIIYLNILFLTNYFFCWNGFESNEHCSKIYHLVLNPEFFYEDEFTSLEIRVKQ